ncbi:MAG: TVP38/TMEM64 family protein [Lachnospiraceae bacterium]|nr:TVP38/TMEM64 family protein [Lachnospiraceae bacterium]
MEERVKTPLQKKLLGIAIIALICLLMGIVVVYVGRPMVTMVSDPDLVKAYIESHGIAGVLVFMGMNYLQVIAAVIPGGPFQIAAGYAFGVLKGSLICDIAMTLGSVTVFLLSKRFGMRFVELFVSKEKIASVKFLKTTNRSRFILFLLFLIPGTPKDLISYAVGLTDLDLKTWVLICAVGRFPAIALSAASGNALQNERYHIFAVWLIVTVVLSLIGGVIYRRHNRN